MVKESRLRLNRSYLGLWLLGMAIFFTLAITHNDGTLNIPFYKALTAMFIAFSIIPILYLREGL